ncbi:MAG TPA: cytochrome c, partial [Candidatus Cybelea sp.]|nr:cytochrome c [Candidatus Cybelea sp.]
WPRERRRGRRRTLAPAVCAVLLVAAGAPAFAAGNAENGQRLAERTCASCHVLPDGANNSVPQGPPTFRTIAAERTDDQLRGFLSQPHKPMPNLSLTRREIDDLIAYFGTIRAKPAR